MRIAANALSKEAEQWDNEAPKLTVIEQTLAGMTLTRVEAGIFQIMFGAYEACRAQVEDRAREGATEFTKMADTLRDIEKAYRDTDAQRADEIAALW
ncbi:hypothetical protein DDE18_04125 [Nocardioides gansuensis]|uniref:ESX-1 secretion-associated protein n=2 Tax=Nocardioides gansuensis TaxID=2138300 RepID=A0A2T8FGG9_9ACTN|nr:hypothetical protein DDE18_04125 [Nocardioides gansuensis]